MTTTGGAEFDEPDEDKVESYLVVVVGGIYKDYDRRKDCDEVGDESIELVSCFSLD